ncbi:MAG TPA: DinB family protein [Thermomicrobiales bacterium]|nr:DinB family protein [Thermomicrobiales bacterium]
MSEVRDRLAENRAHRRAVFETLQGVPSERMGDETTWGGGPVDVRFMFLRFSDHEEEHELSVQTRLIEAGFQQTAAQRILARAEMTRGDLLAALVGLEDADLDRAPEGEWPLRRTLAHVINVERSYRVQTLHSVECFLAGKEYERPPDELLPPLDTQLDGTLDDFILRLDAAREAALAALAGLPDDVLAAPTIWFQRPTDVRMRLMRYAHHEREHTAHILKWREQVGRPPTEAQRLLGLAWRARGVLEGHLVGAPDDVLYVAPEGEWTIRQLLAHLAGTEEFLRDRILGATTNA